MAENERQLPRGRHGLPRATVVASQRGRMVAAVLDAVAEHGYARATVSHVVRTARVSRETFYEHFSSKEECYGTAVRASSDALLAAALPELRDAATPVDGVDAFLRAYLGWLAEHPAAARCLMLDLEAPGRPPVDGQPGSIAHLGRELGAAFGRPESVAGDVLAAALQSLVARELRTGTAEDLPQLRAPLMAVVRRHVAGAGAVLA